MKKWPIILLGLMLAGFGWGLLRLFQLRFETGDNYPEYSSLRTDPLGSKAFYDSLGPLCATRRHFGSAQRLGDGRGATVLYLGVAWSDLKFTPAEFKAMESFARSGGRVVMALFPSFQPARGAPFPPGAAMRGPPTNAPARLPPGLGPPRGSAGRGEAQSAMERWGFQAQHAPFDRNAAGTYPSVPAHRKLAADLPETLATHTAVYFDQLNPAWQVVYARRTTTNELPVLITRAMGGGALVLAADSFPFSNEALRRERQSGLLAWLIGSSTRVVFDEAHLGVRESPGVATLARQYHLGGLFLAALALAGLFVWKHSAAFPPADDRAPAPAQAEAAAGCDATSGFVQLLRRHVRPADLMKACLTEWKAHLPPEARPSPIRLEAMQARIDAENALPPAKRNPIRLYRQFHQILAAKAGRPTSTPSDSPS